MGPKSICTNTEFRTWVGRPTPFATRFCRAPNPGNLPIGAGDHERLFGPEGTLVGAVIGSQLGAGGNISYVNATGSLYIGGTVLAAPAQIGGGGGFSLSYTLVPATQNANSIANGTSSSVAFQPSVLLGSVVSKSPGSGPPVVGYQVGTRSPVSFSASHNICIRHCGC